MAFEIVTTVIASSTALVVAVVGYWFTKKREREAELRKERLAHYKELVSSLSDILEGDNNLQGQKRFAVACNNLNLVAPASVIKALQAFQDETKSSNPSRTFERHDELLSLLLVEMRRDLNISPDGESRLTFRLWAPGKQQ
ncbi:hypothetical protein [Yersinia intermedia]|uniref:hypothetical protein n=1 Tax=Yersinia intermedia TaxID=631 RepID=UPI000B408E86|nr:hypothetical protein [Yersinia intermedia]MCB5298810.1 hypothetical protein [Yersinia intermedia]OVZ75575.1 hypothetical protein CBW55_08410 [Yersinia intermedia]HEN3425760.1 hypothetical protein [Yersinia enterocolitica]